MLAGAGAHVPAHEADADGAAIGPLDIRRVMAALPHRYPMLLVDRVERLVRGRSIAAIKAVSMNESFFAGHFPGRPIMPGVLVIEAMAQAAGLLALYTAGEEEGGKLVYFLGIEEAKFRAPVEPGVLLRLEIDYVQRRGATSRFAGRALVADKVMAQASFTAKLADPPA